MKKQTFFLLKVLIVFFLVSCNKDNDSILLDVDTKAVLTGVFKGASSHTTTGTAEVNQEKTKLFLNNFKTDSGPDLDIYLAKSIEDVDADFINLGDIKGLDGNYSYDIPKNTDLTKYKFVVIWCVDFGVNFGYATLVL